MIEKERESRTSTDGTIANRVTSDDQIISKGIIGFSCDLQL